MHTQFCLPPLVVSPANCDEQQTSIPAIAEEMCFWQQLGGSDIWAAFCQTFLYIRVDIISKKPIRPWHGVGSLNRHAMSKQEVSKQEF